MIKEIEQEDLGQMSDALYVMLLVPMLYAVSWIFALKTLSLSLCWALWSLSDG